MIHYNISLRVIQDGIIKISFYFYLWLVLAFILKKKSSYSINLLCNQCMTDDVAMLFLYTTIDACIVESKFYWYIFNFSPSTNTFWKHFVSSISLESISKFSLLTRRFLFHQSCGRISELSYIKIKLLFIRGR